MSVTFRTKEVSVKEKLNSLECHHHDDRYLQSTGTLSESPVVTITGSITAFRQDGGLVTITGAFSGWTSGAIATLSEAFRPKVDTTIDGVLIATTGAITPTTADGDFSGSYSV